MNNNNIILLHNIACSNLAITIQEVFLKIHHSAKNDEKKIEYDKNK